jgi:hypothetical protein
MFKFYHALLASNKLVNSRTTLEERFYWSSRKACPEVAFDQAKATKPDYLRLVVRILSALSLDAHVMHGAMQR